MISPLQKLLDTFQRERHYKDQKKDEALLAIQHALIETRRYIEESGGVKCEDREREYELSQLWAQASVKARHASSALAVRLNDKSMYWADELQWSQADVEKRGIELAEIQKQISVLLQDA